MISNKIAHRALRRLATHDAEAAHNLALAGMRLQQKSQGVLNRVAKAYQPRNPNPVTVCGIEFPHRIGAAAGLDKQAQVLPYLQALGFGFVEVGSVLPRPQYGNPKPRFFLLPEDHAAINRFGFNSQGVVAIASNLLEAHSMLKIPISVSLGVHKEDIGDEKMILAGYEQIIHMTRRCAAYFALNVSSPNTQGLRDMQARDKIKTTSAQVVEMAKSTPLFVKFSPDMEDGELQLSVEACLEAGVSGFIATNTTSSRRSLRSHKFVDETGGLSGPPLLERALQCVRIIRSIDSRVPIIGVGGVSDVHDADAMFAAGANLVQFYTALFHQGPMALRNISGG